MDVYFGLGLGGYPSTTYVYSIYWYTTYTNVMNLTFCADDFE